MLPFESDLLGLNKELRVQDVFAPSLYVGNGGTQSITNGLNLAAKGGLVWTKNRVTASDPQNRHRLYDSLRGINVALSSNNTNAEQSLGVFSSWNTGGFTLGGGNPSASNVNGEQYVGWSFCRARKFFDVVTWTGDGTTSRSIPHKLGVKPGMISIKARNSSDPSDAWHTIVTYNGGSDYFMGDTVNGNFALNLTNSAGSGRPATTIGITDSVFNASYMKHDVSGNTGVIAAGNQTGQQYVAYVWAHDPSEKGFIQCGRYSGNGSTTGTSVSLGWRPQWLLVKRDNGSQNWIIYDNARATSNPRNRVLYPNLSNSEEGGLGIDFTSDGFTVVTNTAPNDSGGTFVYMAIREPYVKQPVDEVFETNIYTGRGPSKTITNFLDFTGKGGLVWLKGRNTSDPLCLIDTVRGPTRYLFSNTVDAENTVRPIMSSFSSTGFVIGDDSYGNSGGSSHVAWSFLRKPGFFDIVTYTGNGVAGRQIPHSLGTVPGMIIVKKRSSTDNWAVYHRRDGSGATSAGSIDLQLNTTQPGQYSYFGFSGSPRNMTSTFFTVGTASEVNGNGDTYVAYIFGHDTSADGMIQCGIYIGNGSSVGPSVNLGWRPQYLLIKSSSNTNSAWTLLDTQRNNMDQYLEANTASIENSNNFLDTSSTGFQIVDPGFSLNGNGTTYIYMAIRAGSYS